MKKVIQGVTALERHSINHIATRGKGSFFLERKVGYNKEDKEERHGSC